MGVIGSAGNADRSSEGRADCESEAAGEDRPLVDAGVDEIDDLLLFLHSFLRLFTDIKLLELELLIDLARTSSLDVESAEKREEGGLPDSVGEVTL